MSFGNVAYLTLVIVGFVSFAGGLAYVSWWSSKARSAKQVPSFAPTASNDSVTIRKAA